MRKRGIWLIAYLTMGIIFTPVAMLAPPVVRSIDIPVDRSLRPSMASRDTSPVHGGRGTSSIRSVVRLTPKLPAAISPGTSVDVIFIAQIAKGWHINANRPRQEHLIPTEISLEVPAGFEVAEIAYPAAIEKSMAFEESPLSLYEGDVSFRIKIRIAPSVLPGAQNLRAKLHYQACDDEKCQAPATAELVVPLAVSASAGESKSGAASVLAPPEVSVSSKNSSLVSSMLKEKGMALTLLAIFLGGILLNLTPCVYPMIPITVAIFGGADSKGAPARSAVAYFLGIVLTYSILGTVAGLTGGLFGAVLQYPPVLVVLAAIMIYLAAAMFGWAPFGLTGLAQRLGGGKIPLGAFGLGATMGVVAAPCIGPIVVGLLAYVGSQKSAVAGFVFFGVLSAGLGLPYLILGFLSGKICHLPKSGEWMDTVKWVFGFILLCMGVYFMSPLISNDAETRLYEVISACGAVTAVWSSVGKPRKQMVFGIFLALAFVAAGYAFESARSRADLEEFWIDYDDYSFKGALASHHPILIDFSAEWCAPCQRLDRVTWSNADVRKAMDHVVRLKVDLTPYDAPESARLREKFKITGVPTSLYIDPGGHELLRYEGFFGPEEFLLDLMRVSAAGE